MANSDAFPEASKTARSRRDFEQRKADRLAGKLNKPIGGVRGLANVVARMSGRVLHPIDCICTWCMPEDMRLMMLGPDHEALRTDEPTRAPKDGPRWRQPEPEPAKPVTVLPSQGAPKHGRSKWDQRGRSGN